jgi:N-acetylmuramoyl-L-alanine amidase
MSQSRSGRLTTLCVAIMIAGAHPAHAAPPDGHPSSAAACQPESFKVALDIGHYKAAPGATSATGVTEFEYNLSLGHAVLAALRQAGFKSAFLIGESGAPLRLEERTRLAKAAGAVLFLSLHHDSVQPRYLSEWTVKGHPQHYSDLFHGFSIFISARNVQEKQSQQFATLLGEALVANGLTPSLHHAEDIPGENRPLLDKRIGLYRFDDLVVLRTATMPATLLESAIIVNRSEEQAVRDGSYHKHVVAAVVEAIRSFCGLSAAPN